MVNFVLYMLYHNLKKNNINKHNLSSWFLEIILINIVIFALLTLSIAIYVHIS